MLARRANGNSHDSKRAHQSRQVAQASGPSKPTFDGAGGPSRPRTTCWRSTGAARRNRAVVGASNASSEGSRSGVVDPGRPPMTGVVDTTVVAYYLLGTEP